MNPRNHRIERQIQTNQFVGSNGGESIPITYTSSERAVYEANCPQCGREHTVNSFSQMLLKDRCLGFSQMLLKARCLECLKNTTPTMET